MKIRPGVIRERVILAVRKESANDRWKQLQQINIDLKKKLQEKDYLISARNESIKGASYLKKQKIRIENFFHILDKNILKVRSKILNFVQQNLEVIMRETK